MKRNIELVTFHGTKANVPSPGPKRFLVMKLLFDVPDLSRSREKIWQNHESVLLFHAFTFLYELLP